MRKMVFVILAVMLALSLNGCMLLQVYPREPSYVPAEPTAAPTQDILPTDGTEPTASQPVEQEPSEPAQPVEPQPTAPEHSSLYIPGVDVEDVVCYFHEVCLDAEIVNSGDASVLQRWTGPIYYILSGNYTQEDIAILRGFVDWLNTVEGFPGIYETKDWGLANLRFYFTTAQGMMDIMGSNFSGMDGAVTFWYRFDEIYDATICIRTEVHQQLRNSVILEELYNGLGPIQDTALREDSIIYSGYSEPQALTQIDELLLRLLYHPQLQCGMNAQECEQIIRQLYY